MHTLRQALQQAHKEGLDRIDAQMLLLHALDRPTHDRAWLLAHDIDILSPSANAHFADLVARRAQGEPVAYLTGHKAFHGLDLSIDARVLDPRPDTETLVDWALDLLPTWPQPRALDLGTGSGAVALAIKNGLPQTLVHASDLSADALEVARGNAQALGLAVQFHGPGAWLAPLPADARFELIASNPPYIAEGDPHLHALRHEPPSALTSGPDGLDDIRTIVVQSLRFLVPGGWLLLEHRFDQAGAVCALLAQAGFENVSSRMDLAGIARCSGGQWAGGG